MKKVYYIFLTIALLISGCGKHSQPLPEEIFGTSIELDASADSQNPARGIVSGVGDLKDDGFVVWGHWTKDATDAAIFTGDYASGYTNLVFGSNGTTVYATDSNNDGEFNPGVADTWYYTPRRYWHRGIYTFAAALPASAVNSSHAKTEADRTGRPITGSLDHNVLTLDFGKDASGNPSGFDLATHQTDLMIAAAVDVDNTAEDQSTVQLGFERHQFVQIEIQAACMDQHADIIVDEVTFYGNKRYTAGPMTFTLGEESITASYGLSTVTTEGNPYKVIGNIGTKLPNAQAQQSTDGTTSWEYDYKTIVSGLLVFPEECQMSLVVKYRAYMDDDTVTSDTLVGTISSVSVQWEQGMKYVYKLLISQHRVDIVGSDIMEWNEVDVEHTFS